MCDVLREMRKCLKTNNFSYLGGLIEEAQSMGNRMEAGLENNSSRRYKLKMKITKLKAKVKDLKRTSDKPVEPSQPPRRGFGAGG